MFRRSLLGAVALIATCIALPAAHAQSARNFPEKPIKLVIAFPAGGPTDVTMRQLAENAGKQLGQPIIIENKPGAGGTLPAQALQTVQPDGYTLAQMPLGVFRLPYTTKINWDPVKDISYVLNVTGYAFGIVVPADSPLKTWMHFVAWAKTNPGKLTYGSTGTMTSPHLTTELIAQKLGIELLHVPYKGSAPAVTDLIGGQVESMFDNTPSALPHVQGGRLRAIAITSAQRSPLLPDVPTLAESGFPGFDVQSWFALAAPAGTPKPIIDQTNAALNKVLAQPDVRQRLQDLAATPAPGTPEQMRSFAGAEIKRWHDVVKASGAKAE